MVCECICDGCREEDHCCVPPCMMVPLFERPTADGVGDPSNVDADDYSA